MALLVVMGADLLARGDAALMAVDVGGSSWLLLAECGEGTGHGLSEKRRPGSGGGVVPPVGQEAAPGSLVRACLAVVHAFRAHPAGTVRVDGADVVVPTP